MVSPRTAHRAPLGVDKTMMRGVFPLITACSVELGPGRASGTTERVEVAQQLIPRGGGQGLGLDAGKSG